MRLKLFSVAVLFVVSLPVLAADGEGYIKLRTTPRGAGIFLDGKYVGPAGRFSVPERYAVAPGSHEISLKEPRYEDYTGKIDARAGKPTKMTDLMKKKPQA